MARLTEVRKPAIWNGNRTAFTAKNGQNAVSDSRSIEGPMARPWDVPPLPTKGDAHDYMTYRGVGRVSSEWQGVELELLRLFATFMRTRDLAAAASVYRSSQGFRGRFEMLTRAADNYFAGLHDERLEAHFHELATQVLGLSERRDDVVHGMLARLDRVAEFRAHLNTGAGQKRHFGIVSPHHMLKKSQPAGKASFAYTSVGLTRLADRLLALAGALKEHQDLLYERERQARKSPGSL
jgi:hypothetical protein